MISHELMIYCFLLGGLYLLIISVIHEAIGKHLPILKGYPEDMIEKVTIPWFVANFFMEFLFFVVIPTFAYSFFYMIFPLSGIRTGFSGALVGFTLGAIPAIMGLSLRLKLPTPFLLYFLLGILLKLAGAMAVIGYLHSL